jgi:hypothetical protein
MQERATTVSLGSVDFAGERALPPFRVKPTRNFVLTEETGGLDPVVARLRAVRYP